MGFNDMIEGLRYMKSLERLELIAGVNRVGANGAEKFRSVMQNMTSLKHLKIDFLENYVGDYGSKLLTDGLAFLTSLETLDLSLNFNNLLAYGAIESSKGVLAIADKLTFLKFDLSQNEIKDEFAADVIKIVEKICAKLKGKMEFIFMNTGITKKGLATFEAQLKKI